ncbi:MAG: succinylglutamate desuccinylase/aspartoacylase family protein [Brasilonema angustatum HA4187-MV1]|nr:succinylglutamate desuccinylase/aspartoacylase family protein [Brasilonema angustatum HA4187-MV1]
MIDADYLIDLHSHTSQGLNYLYLFRNQEESAKYFLLEFGILFKICDEDGFDKAFIQPWLALENCFQQLGKEIKFDLEAWTLELGTGMQMNPVSVEKGLRGVKNYLAQKGVLRISGFPVKESESHNMNVKLTNQMRKYYASTGGMIQSRVELGSCVKAGGRIYQMLTFNKEGQLPSVIDVNAEQDGFVYDISSNQAVNEGEFVLGIIE